MTGRFTNVIRENARTLRRLHARIHETLERRDESPAGRREWEAACEEFHRRYDGLAFPGAGWQEGLRKLKQGERNAVEEGLCFLECRPYFFRSGYMYPLILRYVKRAELTEAQEDRFDTVVMRDQIWRTRRLHGKGSAEEAELIEFLKSKGCNPPEV